MGRDEEVGPTAWQIPRSFESRRRFQDGSMARRIGLALAGGGVLAAAHVGVLRALAEAGLEIAMAAGVSAGALIAALWADGKSWDELLELSGELGFRILDPNLCCIVLPWRRHRVPGIFLGERLEKLLRQFLSVEDLSQLGRPCAVVTADLLTGRTLAFASQPATADLPPSAADGTRPEWHVGGPAARLLRGSMAVPVLFPPVPYGSHLLVDGGVVDHVPAWAVRALGADFVIGVELSSWDVLAPERAVFSPLAVGARALRLAQRSTHVGIGPDLLITPEFPPNSSILDFRRLRAHYDAGYKAAQAALPRLEARLLGSEPA